MAIRLRSARIAYVALLGLAAPAHGLGLLADDRLVTRTVTPGCCDEHYEADFFAPFDVPYQSSSIPVTSDGLGLDGSVAARANGFHDDHGNFYSSVSVFSIGFRIDGDGSIALGGCFESSFDAVPAHGSVLLLAGDQVLFARERDPYEPCMDEHFEFAAEVAPGAYTLEARAAASGTDWGVFVDFAFEVRDTAHPIPEPSTFATLAAGLAWLGTWRRRAAIGGT